MPKIVKEAKREVKHPDLATLVSWHEAYLDATSTARKEAARDLAYYDGDQWTADEISKLVKRGQPVITINRLARKVNFILGTEVRTRVDPKALPRTRTHEDATEVATDALRYVAEKEDFDGLRSKVFKQILIPGLGGACCYTEIKEGKRGPAYGAPSGGERMRPDATAEYDLAGPQPSYGDTSAATAEAEENEQRTVEIRLDFLPWDRIFYDPHSSEEDFCDAKDKGTVTWMYLEDAIAEYPEHEEALRSAMSESGQGSETSEDDKPRHSWVDTKSKRIKVLEHYYRCGTDDWYRCDHTSAVILREPQLTGYINEDGNHDCPLVLISGYIDQDNNRYGMLRNLISPQDEINKRRSKALWHSSVNQIVAEENALLDVTAAQTQRARADGVIIVQPNALNENRVQFPAQTEMVQTHFSLLQEAKQEIDACGPDAPVIAGQTTAATSGRAILARQQAGSMELEPLFDNLRKWQRQIFRKMWCHIRQFWTEERWLRVTDDAEKTGYRFVAINQNMTRAQRLEDLMGKDVELPQAMKIAAGDAAPLVMGQVNQQMQAIMEQAQQAGAQVPPEALRQQAMQMILQHPAMQERIRANAVEELDVDIIIDAAPEMATIQAEQFEVLVQLAQAGIPIPPDVIIEASSLRNKEKLLEMLKKPEDPQAAQLQQAAVQLQMAQAGADVEKTKSEATKNQAQAAKAASEVQGAPMRQARDQAQAMHMAAAAGEKAGGIDGPGAMSPM